MGVWRLRANKKDKIDTFMSAVGGTQPRQLMHAAHKLGSYLCYMKNVVQNDLLNLLMCALVAITDASSAFERGRDVVVGFGRRNPNASKGRERRGAKKKNRK